MILQLVLALALTQADESAVVRELTQIEQQLAANWKNGDCAAWGAIVAPEWSVIHITGTVITRAEALDMCTARAAPIEAFEVAELSARVFGNAAVVTGLTTATVGGSAPVTVRLRFTDVFIRRAGRWVVVASHATRLGS